MKRNLTPADLQKLAYHGLSKFNGDDDGYANAYDGEGGMLSYGGGNYPDAYTGADDALLSFEGANSFDNRTQKRSFSFTLTNGNVTDEVVYLCGGLVDPRGTIADGVFLSVAGNNITGTSTTPGKTIATLLAFAKINPLEAVQMSIRSTNASQVQQNLLQDKQIPWAGSNDQKFFDVSAGQDQYVYQSGINVVNVPGLIFSRTMLITYTLLASSSVTLTFYFGAAADQTNYLQQRQQLAAVKGVQLPGGAVRKRIG